MSSLLVPNHLYELLPISVLIGTIFRDGSPGSKLRVHHLAHQWFGAMARTSSCCWGWVRFFVLLSFAVGDYLAPASDRAAQLLKARYQNKITVGQTGAWLKEKQTVQQLHVVNVKALVP